MKETLKRLAGRLYMLERRRKDLAQKIDLAHRQNDITSALSLEMQYQEVMGTIVRMRNVLHMYNFRIVRDVPGRPTLSY